jgi:RNA polymerase sigma-70 factor (ECF subfamily)
LNLLEWTDLTSGPEANAASRRIEEWAQQARQGDGAAFDELMAALWPTVYRFAWSLLGDRTEAEDATQETFLRALRFLERYDARRPFRPWLYRVAVNVCRDQVRRRRREAALWERAADLVRLDHETHRSEPFPPGEIRAAVRQLPERQREVVVLFYFEDLGCRDVAEALGLTVNHVKVLLHRARQRLRETLEAAEGQCL